MQQVKRNAQQSSIASSTQQQHPGQTSASNAAAQHTESAPQAPMQGQYYTQGINQPMPRLEQPFATGNQQAPQHGQHFTHGAQQAPQYGQPFTHGAQQAPQHGQHFTHGAQQTPQHGPPFAPGIQQQAVPYGQTVAQAAQHVPRDFLSQQAAAHGPNYSQTASKHLYNTAGNKQNGSMESILVKIVLPIVFIIVLLIGILMLFIAGIAYGLITEPVRCLLGLLLAAGMYIFGMLQQRFKRPIWGKTLLGGAHGVFIITVSIAHLTYEIIGVAIAALAYVLAFALITFSAIRWRSQLLVCIAVISGYLCMFLIDVTNIHMTAFIIVQLVFSISMIMLCTKLNYRIAYGFAYLLLHFSLLITYNIQEYNSHKLLLAALIIQHLIVFFAFIRRKLIHVEQVVVQIIGIIALICWTAELYHLPGGISLTYSLVTIIIAMMYACSLLYFERELSQAEGAEDSTLHRSLILRTEISTIIIAIALLCFFIEIVGASFIGLALLLIGVSLVLYGLRDEHPILRWFGGALSFIGAVTIIFDYPSKLLSYEILSWLIMLISIPLIYREYRSKYKDSRAQAPLLSAILWIEAILTFIFVTITADLIGIAIDADGAGPYIISAAWLLYALGAIVFGTIRKLSKARLTGLLLLLVIVIKVIFIDITFLNILSKSIIFTVLGGIGILVSFFLYNRTDEESKQ